MAKRTRGEEHRRRLLPDVAVSDDRIAGLHARLLEERDQLLGRLEVRAILVDFGVRNALRAWNVAKLPAVTAAATPRNAVIEHGIARIDDRNAGRCRVCADVVRVDDDGTE